MSKDEKLCNTVLNLYNEDVKEYRWINYEGHEMFTAIKWHEDKELELKHAFFDINNDGKNEFVIKFNSRLRGIDSDHLLIYPETSDVLSRMKPGSGGLRGLFDTPNQLFSRNNNVYYLKDISNGAEVGAEVFFVLRPFIWQGTNYISLTDRNVTKGDIMAITPRWIVIAKYKQAEELQDICYYLNPSIKH